MKLHCHDYGSKSRQKNYVGELVPFFLNYHTKLTANNFTNKRKEKGKKERIE